MSGKREWNGKLLPVGVSARVLKDGTVRFDARTRSAAGRFVTTTHATAREADIARQERLGSMRKGGTGDPAGGKRLLKDWVEVWWAARAKKRRHSTLARDFSYIKRHLVADLGDYKLVDLRPWVISVWVNDMLDKGLAPSTVAKHRQLLSNILDFAVREELITTNFARLVEPPTVERKERRYVEPQEALAIEEVMPEWWRPTIPTMADSGLRIGELASLDARHLVVLVEGIGGTPVEKNPLEVLGSTILGGALITHHSMTEAPKWLSGAATRLVIGDTKTAAGRRTVPMLTASTAKRLVAMIHERGQTLDSPLFIGRRGARMSPHNWRERVWNVAVRKASIREPFPTPHAMRHLAVSIWIASGENKFHVARFAGHKDTNTVETIYAHLLNPDTTETREGMERIREAAKKAREEERTKIVPLRDPDEGDEQTQTGGA